MIGYEDEEYVLVIILFLSGTVSWWMKLKPKIWSIFDEPYSSSYAKVRVEFVKQLG